MYVENLSKEQLEAFLREYLDDFHPDLPKIPKIDLCDNKGEWAQSVQYCSKEVNKYRSIYLMDDRVEPMISREFEKAWIQYLHSIFGRKYKKWFLKQ